MNWDELSKEKRLEIVRQQTQERIERLVLKKNNMIPHPLRMAEFRKSVDGVNKQIAQLELWMAIHKDK